MTRSDGLRERVRERYAEAATTVLEGGGSASCCDSECGTVAGSGSASCCGPSGLEVDQTFGGGLYSRGERDELPLAAVAASLGCGNPTAVAELREGERVLDLGSGGGIDVLLPDGSVDVVISNCVINLSTDKHKVINEMYRMLVPGGRIGISDVVAEDHLTPAERAEHGSYVGCIAGALSRSEYLASLAAAGFADASVEFIHRTADGMHSAIIQATKPR